ncbi:MAG: hypothetical protein LBR77_09055 [Lachnospiraceae bacterium]|jgi:hypothetical protein|nr:hypothetical protein [Lachnospiraceae bacterium]
MPNVSPGKSMLYSALYTGAIGVGTQVVYLLCAALVGREFPLLVPMMLIVCGIIFTLLYLAGVTQRFTAAAGMGALLCLIGLSPGTSEAINAQRKEGVPLWKAYHNAQRPVHKMMLTAFLVDVVVSLLFSLIYPSDAFPIIAPNPAFVPAPVGIALSFVFAAAVGLCAQGLAVATHAGMKGIMRIMYGAYFVSMVISFVGAGQYLAAVAPGGFNCTVFCAGEMIFDSVFAGMKFGLIPDMVVKLIVFCLIITLMFAFGVVASAVAYRKQQQT